MCSTVQYGELWVCPDNALLFCYNTHYFSLLLLYSLGALFFGGGFCTFGIFKYFFESPLKVREFMFYYFFSFRFLVL